MSSNDSNVLKLIEQGLTSPPTQYRLYGRREKEKVSTESGSHSLQIITDASLSRSVHVH